MHAWQGSFPGRRLSVSVNISSRQLLQPDLVDRVRAALELNGIDPSWLTLEITEGALLQGVVGGDEAQAQRAESTRGPTRHRRLRTGTPPWGISGSSHSTS